MSKLLVKTFPDPILRKKAEKITKVTDSVKKILSEMAEAMYLNNGVGLAAVQVGIDQQLAVVDIGSGLIKMINPVILKKSGTEALEEGCLSVPGAEVKVRRAKKVFVSFLAEDGQVRQMDATGLLARAIQHEIDHLSGILIIDYLNPFKRMLFRAAKRKGLDKTPCI